MAFPTDQTVSRIGQQNATGDVRSLFLKLYAGEVLTAFEERNIFMPLHRTRTISNGKSAQFPMTGTASAKYHNPGELIQGDIIKKAKYGGLKERNNSGQGYSSQMANYDQFQNISIDTGEYNRAMNNTMTEFSPRLPKDSQRDHSRREGSVYKSRET